MNNIAYLPGRQPQEALQEGASQSRGPQLEEGHIKIANELYEAIMVAPLTLREMRVVMAVIRLTYGWNRKQARITGGLLAKLTGMPSTKASKTLASLVEKNVVIRHGGSRSPVSINKLSDQWLLEALERKTPPPKRAKTPEIDQTGCAEPKRYDSYQNGKSESYQNGNASKDRKDNIEPKGSIDSSNKKSRPKKWGEEIDHELAELMFSRVTADLTNPKRPNMNSWANEIRLMRTSDKRTEKQIRYLINWVADDEFWSTVVMCPTKLRKKWDQLEKKVVAYKESRHANRSPSDAKRAEQDRIAARLANPNDDGWMDGLFEEDAAAGAGKPSVYPVGGDLPEDMAHSVQHGSDADPGQAGGGYLDGEVVNPADDASRGCGGGANQGGRRGVAPERGQSGEVVEAEAGGFWNA